MPVDGRVAPDSARFVQIDQEPHAGTVNTGENDNAIGSGGGDIFRHWPGTVQDTCGRLIADAILTVSIHGMDDRYHPGRAFLQNLQGFFGKLQGIFAVFSTFNQAFQVPFHCSQGIRQSG